MELSNFPGSRANDTALAPCRNAWLCCHLSIVALALVLPGGRVGSPPRPFSAADVLVIACVALFIVALGLFHQRGRAALRLAVFWTAVVLTLIIARRVTPAGSPAMAVVFMLGCLVHWRVGASRIQALVSREAVSPGGRDAIRTAEARARRARPRRRRADGARPAQSLSAVLALVDKQGADKAEAVHHDFLRSVRDQVQYGLSVAQHFMQRSRAERLDRSRFLPVSLQDLAHSAADQVLPWPTRRACRSTCGTAMKRCGSPATIACCCAPSSICWRTPSSIRLPARGSRWARSGWAMPRVCTWRTRAWASRPRPCPAVPGVLSGPPERAGTARTAWAWATIVAAVAKGHGAEVMGEIAAEPGQHVHPDHAAVAARRMKTKILQNPAKPQGAAVRLEVRCLDGAFYRRGQCRPRRGWSGGRGAGRGARSSGSGQLALRY